jgi:hypothetical protein
MSVGVRRVRAFTLALAVGWCDIDVPVQSSVSRDSTVILNFPSDVRCVLGGEDSSPGAVCAACLEAGGECTWSDEVKVRLRARLQLTG